MKIVICDDEIQYVNALKKHIEEYMKKRLLSFEIYTFTDPTEIIAGGVTCDLAFLDIQMEKANGISVAKELKKRNSKMIIFFITSYNEYQDDAMDLRAFRFFEKPFKAERLYSGLDKAMEYLSETYVDFYLQDGKAQQRILVDNIMYLENRNRKTILYEAECNYVTREKLEQWADKLPHSFFYRVHKSFIVNLHCVDRYNYTELYLNDGTRIPVSSRKQADFHKYWFSYLRRR